MDPAAVEEAGAPPDLPLDPPLPGWCIKKMNIKNVIVCIYVTYIHIFSRAKQGAASTCSQLEHKWTEQMSGIANHPQCFWLPSSSSRHESINLQRIAHGTDGSLVKHDSNDLLACLWFLVCILVPIVVASSGLLVELWKSLLQQILCTFTR